MKTAGIQIACTPQSKLASAPTAAPNANVTVRIPYIRKALREPAWPSTNPVYPASTKRIRLPVVAMGMYGGSPMLRNRPIWLAARYEIGIVTKLGGTEAGTNPTAASAAAWLAMIHRRGWRSSFGELTDLMCEDVSTPAKNANIGQRWPSASAQCRRETSMAPKITFAVCTLANTPPRVM